MMDAGSRNKSPFDDFKQLIYMDTPWIEALQQLLQQK
jgi:hypothetical protein